MGVSVPLHELADPHLQIPDNPSMTHISSSMMNHASCTFDVLTRHLLLGGVADVTHELEVVQVDLVCVDISEVAIIGIDEKL